MKHSLVPVLCISATLGLALSLPVVAQGAEDLPEDTSRVIVQGSTLEDFFTAAIDYSPRLRIAEQNWKIGTSRKKQATGQLLPQINANASFSENRQENTTLDTVNRYPGKRYSVQLTQVLFNWRAFAQRSRASSLEEQAEAEYYAELAWLLADVSEKYFNVLAAEDAVESIAAEVDATRNQLDQIRSLYELQSAQITDLYNAEAQLAAAQAGQLDLQSNLALAREELRAVSGVGVGPLFRLDEQITVPTVDESVQSWIDRARNGNFEILARRYAVEAADKGISMQRGAYMPRVSLIAQQQLSDVGYDNTLSPRTDTSYVGVDVTIPLFAGGTNRATVSEAKSVHNIAENELRQAELEVVERTRTAYLQVKSSELRTDAAEKLAESTALSFTARQRGFELGAVTSVDVLNALRDRFQAERDLQRTRYDHIKYNLMLKREAGTLSAEDLMEVGTWLVPPQE